MPIYTFDTALEAMRNNSSLQAICYKMELQGSLTYSFILEREDNYFWHMCEVIGAEYSNPILLWKKLILPRICCSLPMNPCLPAPCSPLIRQTATGYISPIAQVSLTIKLPPSCLSSPESCCLAPIAKALSPLALSRQTSSSIEEEATGIDEKVNTHLFFDDDGNEISKEDYENQFYLEIDNKPFRHPRVLLFYLRYISSSRELESNPELFPWPLLTSKDREAVKAFLLRNPPSSEFEQEVNELLSLMNCCPEH